MEVNLAAAAAARATPEVRAKLAAWQRSPENPIYDPVVMRRREIAARERGFAHLTGGHGLTVPQRLLAARLGWGTVELTTKTNDIKGKAKRTGRPLAKRPYWYRVDIADPVLKIAIEVDGQSHRSVRVKERDRRKTEFLRSRGWRVLRFTNRRILSDLEGVVAEIMSAVRSTTSKP
jgi:hypothetical protein